MCYMVIKLVDVGSIIVSYNVESFVFWKKTLCFGVRRSDVCVGVKISPGNVTALQIVTSSSLPPKSIL